MPTEIPVTRNLYRVVSQVSKCKVDWLDVRLVEAIGPFEAFLQAALAKVNETAKAPMSTHHLVKLLVNSRVDFSVVVLNADGTDANVQIPWLRRTKLQQQITDLNEAIRTMGKIADPWPELRENVTVKLIKALKADYVKARDELKREIATIDAWLKEILKQADEEKYDVRSNFLNVVIGDEDEDEDEDECEEE